MSDPTTFPIRRPRPTASYAYSAIVAWDAESTTSIRWLWKSYAYLPVVFEPAPDADWTLEETWRAANPSLGVTKSLEYMRAECAAAQAEPRKRNSFLRLELNIWTESRTVWIAPEAWEACEAAPAEDLAELPCCGGLDLSSAVDLTALALVFKRRRAPRVEDLLRQARRAAGRAAR